MRVRYVYAFDEDSGGGRELLGGKGVGLAEMTALGVLSPDGELLAPPPKPGTASGRPIVPRRAITAHAVMNEAYAYPQPSSFTRGIRVDPGQTSLLLISGTQFTLFAMWFDMESNKDLR